MCPPQHVPAIKHNDGIADRVYKVPSRVRLDQRIELCAQLDKLIQSGQVEAALEFFKMHNMTPTKGEVMTRNKHWRFQQGVKRAIKVISIYRAAAYLPDDFYANNGPYAKKLRNTRVPCSCPMCGNPRRWFGKLTKQEIIHSLGAEKAGSAPGQDVK